MRRIRYSIILILAAALLGSCGPQPKDCSRPDVFCVGLVTGFGGVNTGLNREAWLALQDAQAAHLADRIDYIETVNSRDREANIRVLAADGYDVIVTVGTSIARETAQAASRYGKLYFIGVDQPQEKKIRNLTGLVFHEEFGGFMAGALAARMTKTGQIAAVCEANFIDPVRRYCEGFQAGALYVRPGSDVTVAYRDGSSGDIFNDPEWGRSTALEQVNQGADVVFATGGATADAALEAAASEGAYVIGSETDLYADLPDIRPRLLTSAINDVRTNLVELITLTKRGSFPAGEYMGTESLAPWHDFERQIPTAVKVELDQIYTRLALGVVKLKIPYTQP